MPTKAVIQKSLKKLDSQQAKMTTIGAGVTMNIVKAIQSALHYYQNGDLEHAGRVCREILKKQPKNADVLHLLGVISYQDHNYDASIHHIKKSLKINPANSEAYYNLGRAFQQIGEIDKAIES
jgi:Flp pilus assembly protein TadD